MPITSYTDSLSPSSSSTLSQTANIILPEKYMAEKHDQTYQTNNTASLLDEEEGTSIRNKKKKKRRMDNRNGCLRCLCCACCLPKWATYIVWFIIISIIIVVIVLGAIMSKFVLPTIEVGSVTNSTMNGASPISFNGDNLQLNFGLTINAKNPNLLPIYVSNMNATAFYPDPLGTGKQTPIGGGFLQSQELPKYSDFSFIFPFSIVYDSMVDPDQVILNDLAEKCGLTGEEPQDLTISYTIHVTAKVLFVSVHPTINSQSTFACPIQSDENGSFLKK